MLVYTGIYGDKIRFLVVTNLRYEAIFRTKYKKNWFIYNGPESKARDCRGNLCGCPDAFVRDAVSRLP